VILSKEEQKQKKEEMKQKQEQTMEDIKSIIANTNEYIDA